MPLTVGGIYSINQIGQESEALHNHAFCLSGDSGTRVMWQWSHARRWMVPGPGMAASVLPNTLSCDWVSADRAAVHWKYMGGPELARPPDLVPGSVVRGCDLPWYGIRAHGLCITFGAIQAVIKYDPCGGRQFGDFGERALRNFQVWVNGVYFSDVEHGRRYTVADPAYVDNPGPVDYSVPPPNTRHCPECRRDDVFACYSAPNGSDCTDHDRTRTGVQWGGILRLDGEVMQPWYGMIDHRRDHRPDSPWCNGPNISRAIPRFEVSTCGECLARDWTSNFAEGRCSACNARREEIRTRGVQATDLRFGVEMETEGIDYRRQAGAIAVAMRKQRKMEWTAKPDGSLRGASAEVVTPPLLYNEAGLVELCEGAKRLRNAGARHSGNTGLHIHVDCGLLNSQQLLSVAKWWYAMQPAVLAALPPLSTRRGFCHDFSYENLSTANARVRYGNTSHMAYVTDKYTTLNFAPLSSYGTVEFRLFNGTLHRGKLRAYVTFATHFVAYAARNNDEAVRTFGRDRAAMEDVLDRLGITDKSHRYHLLGQFAEDADLPCPEGVVAKKRPRIPQKVRHQAFLALDNYMLITAREFSRLGLPCEVIRLGTNFSAAGWADWMRRGNSLPEPTRVGSRDVTMEGYWLAIPSATWNQMVVERRVTAE